MAVLLLTAVAMLRTWFLEGFPMGCQVSGGSMAETLLGRHRDVVCADCGHRFPCNAEEMWRHGVDRLSQLRLCGKSGR